MLDAHRQWLAERAPEVNYSARILWQELRAQRGFVGSYVIVRRAVAPLRLAASVAALTQARFETGPGEQAQCDWGEVFGDRVIATAILDRLLHHAVTMNIRGNSYRLKDKLKAGLVRSDDDNSSQPGGEI